MMKLSKDDAFIDSFYHKSLVLLLIIALSGVFGSLSFASSSEINDKNWDKLKKEWKFSSSISGGVNLKGYFFTRKVLKELYEESWIKEAPAKLRIIRNLESRWSKKTPLKLKVELQGNSRFHPWEIVFNQGGRKQKVDNFADIYTFMDIEGTKRIPDSGSFVLFIHIPEWLNLKRSFVLFYGTEEFSLGPLHTEAD